MAGGIQVLSILELSVNMLCQHDSSVASVMKNETKLQI
jgi:hypothetical protein